jgi:hypothetical protein
LRPVLFGLAGDDVASLPEVSPESTSTKIVISVGDGNYIEVDKREGIDKDVLIKPEIPPLPEKKVESGFEMLKHIYRKLLVKINRSDVKSDFKKVGDALEDHSKEKRRKQKSDMYNDKGKIKDRYGNRRPMKSSLR